MIQPLFYKTHSGSVRYNAVDGRFYGKLESTLEPVTFEAASAKRLRKEFERAVEYYLEFCQVAGSAP